jgi:hypothetical protein
MTNREYQNLTDGQRIAEIERVRAGYPVDHRQVEKINEQIETIRRKVNNGSDNKKSNLQK